MADTAHFRGEGGVVFEMDLPLPEAIEQRVRLGAIVRVGGPDGQPYVPTGDEPQVAEPPTTRPSLSAPKADWVAWAANHPDPARRLPVADAEVMSRTELVTQFKD